jgi:hypothetical protein
MQTRYACQINVTAKVAIVEVYGPISARIPNKKRITKAISYDK